MQPEFWHHRWAINQINFHEPVANPLLVAHFAALDLPANARVFVPLCGKTLDIDWLLSRDYRVVGAELSAQAVTQLFERLGVEPTARGVGALECRSAAGLDVFVGDFFDLSADQLGPVDAVYDRAALIAMPAELRTRYARHVLAVSKAAPQLLVTMEYDQTLQNGPPFSVPAAQLPALYAGRQPQLLASQDIPGGLKGRCPATEKVWRLP
jgi:thiopurine S-methyltransferase